MTTKGETTMTQIALFKNEQVMVVGIDSRVIYFNEDKSEGIASINKFFRLSPEVFMSIAGSGYGTFFGLELIKHVYTSRLWDYEAILSRSFLFLRANADWLKKEIEKNSKRRDLERFYILLFGRSKGKFRADIISFECSEEASSTKPQLFPAGDVITIPRQIGLEASMAKQHSKISSPQEITKMMLSYFRRLACVTEDLGPPYYFACFDKDSFIMLTFNE